MIRKLLRDACWLFWSRIYDVCGAVECNAAALRLRAVAGMSDATDWGIEGLAADDGGEPF